MMTILNATHLNSKSTHQQSEGLTSSEQIMLIKNEIKHSTINIVELRKGLNNLIPSLKKASQEERRETFKVLNQIKDKILISKNDWGKNFKDLEKKFIQADLISWKNMPEAKGKISEASEQILKAFNYNCILELDLSNLVLNSLPESIGQLQKLRYLYIGGNQIESLPQSFEKLSQLQRLHLAYSHLKFLPESFGLLSQLQTLDLRGNRLESLPESFGQLSQMQELFLSANRLKSLPESFGQLSQLQILHLSGNRLTFLSESFGQFSQLEELYLDNNRLESLPTSLAQCRRSLAHLSLETNKNLKKLPPSFEFLYLMKVININKTNINPQEVAILRVKWAAAVNEIDTIQLLHIR